MAKLTVKVDKGTLKEAKKLFDELGLDTDTAINLFLHQCVMPERIPFMLGMPDPGDMPIPDVDTLNRWSREALEEMDEDPEYQAWLKKMGMDKDGNPLPVEEIPNEASEKDDSEEEI